MRGVHRTAGGSAVGGPGKESAEAPAPKKPRGRPRKEKGGGGFHRKVAGFAVRLLTETAKSGFG